MYRNMPITPQTTTPKSSTIVKISANNKSNPNDNNNNNGNNNNGNDKDKAKETSSDTAHEIEEISKKISEHADAIYRSWKSRGLAPPQLLEFYTNAAAPGAVTTTTKDTSEVSTDFLASVASAAQVDAANTEGLQQLVNSFVLKDKEQRGVKVGNQSQQPTDINMTGKIVQKAATSNKPVKSAIIMKAEEAAQIVKPKNVVVLKKTIKTPSAPLTTTTTATTTSAQSQLTPKTASSSSLSSSSSAKHKIGNSTLQQEQVQPTKTTTTKVRASEKKAANSNANGAGPSITKMKQRPAVVLGPPSVDINLNLDLDLNLQMSGLSHLQNQNLLKIKELLQDNTLPVLENVKPAGEKKKSATKTIKTSVSGPSKNKLNKQNSALMAIDTDRIAVGVDVIDAIAAKKHTTTTSNGSGGSKIADKNSSFGVGGEVGGKRVGSNTTTTTTTKTNTNKSATNTSDVLSINRTAIDDHDVDQTTSSNITNNKSSATKITTKQAKQTAAAAAAAAAKATTTTATATTTPSSAATIETTKEAGGNSGDGSAISDSGRNGTSLNRTKTTANSTIITPAKDKTLKNPNNKETSRVVCNNNSSNNKVEEQQVMALARSSSTSSMPTGTTKMKVGRSNSLTNGTEKNSNYNFLNQKPTKICMNVKNKNQKKNLKKNRNIFFCYEKFYKFFTFEENN